ncbi:MAG: CPBP family intramembrane metalloprotease [Bacteroidales bacterium]|nr:CPBP family intramembrane metalloprotease [Bacteroidales bacterium]
MRKKRDTYANRYSCDGMPLWRWLLLFVGGTILFLLLYAFGQLTYSIEPALPKCAAIVGAALAILIIYTLLVFHFEKRSVDELHLLKFFPAMGKGLLTGTLFLSAVIGIIAALGGYRVVSVQFDAVEVITQICIFFFVAVGEEILFRGIIYRMISSRWNCFVALIISALLFGFSHMMQPNASVWSSVAIAVEAGLMLGAAYEFSGNLWVPIGIHWAWNFFEGPFYGTTVSGSEPMFSILTPEITGKPLLTGGEFGPEASLVAFILGLGLSIYFLGKALSR